MINKVILIGNVGNEPEFKNLNGGAKVANFPLATNETYNDRNGNKVQHTDWHNIVIWNRLAEVVEQYVNKGDRIYIEGKIRNRSYEAKDGSKRYVTEIFANTMQMLGGKPKSQGQSRNSGQSDYGHTNHNEEVPEPDADQPEPPSGDLPF